MNNPIDSILFNKNFNVVAFAASIIDIVAPIKYSPSQKYTNEYLYICMCDFVTVSVSWNKYRGTIEHPINGKYLNQIHNKWNRLGVYKELHRQKVNKYLETDKEKKLRFQSIDSTFIANKGGSIKNNNHLLSNRAKKKNRRIRLQNRTLPKNERIKEETYIDNNRYNGRKKYIKSSTLADHYGTPLGSTMVSSKQSDSISLIETIENLSVNLNTLRNSKVNRYKQKLLADGGYDTKQNRRYLKRKGYTPIIAYNRKNCKNKKKIKKKERKGQKHKDYKKRFVIEQFFSWIKRFPVINQNYQKTVESYEGLYTLASSIIVASRIHKKF